VTDDCVLELLATDGVYLPIAPRILDVESGVVIPPGGRADVAVYCTGPGRYSLIDLNTNLDKDELSTTCTVDPASSANTDVSTCNVLLTMDVLASDR